MRVNMTTSILMLSKYSLWGFQSTFFPATPSMHAVCTEPQVDLSPSVTTSLSERPALLRESHGLTLATRSDEIVRSSARMNSYPWTSQIGAQPILQDLPETPEAFEISDDEDLDDSASYTYDSADEVYSDSESEDASSEPGDIPGIEAGDGDEILITQPAIDDVEDDFFPCEEDRDEDHLDSHELGHVHASSGIRRWNRNGVVHEIDWSLLKLKDERLQPYNLVQGGKRFCSRPTKLCPKLMDPVNRRHFKPEDDEYPSQVRLLLILRVWGVI